MTASAAAVGADVGTVGWMPGLTGLLNAIWQCVVKIEGCAVRTRDPNVQRARV